MIFHFNINIYKLDTNHTKMSKWLNTNVGSEHEARSWAFLFGYGSYSEPHPYDRIIFTNLEDAAMFKLKYGDIISKSEG